MPDMSFVCMYGFILFYVILCQNPIVPNVNVYFFLGIKLHNNKNEKKIVRSFIFFKLEFISIK